MGSVWYWAFLALALGDLDIWRLFRSASQGELCRHCGRMTRGLRDPCPGHPERLGGPLP